MPRHHHKSKHHRKHKSHHHGSGPGPVYGGVWQCDGPNLKPATGFYFVTDPGTHARGRRADRGPKISSSTLSSSREGYIPVVRYADGRMYEIRGRESIGYGGNLPF